MFSGLRKPCNAKSFRFRRRIGARARAHNLQRNYYADGATRFLARRDGDYDNATTDDDMAISDWISPQNAPFSHVVSLPFEPTADDRIILFRTSNCAHARVHDHFACRSITISTETDGCM